MNNVLWHSHLLPARFLGLIVSNHIFAFDLSHAFDETLFFLLSFGLFQLLLLEVSLQLLR